MTGAVSKDGAIYPVGVGNDGKCGDGTFEVLTLPSASVNEEGA